MHTLSIMHPGPIPGLVAGAEKAVDSCLVDWVREGMNSFKRLALLSPCGMVQGTSWNLREFRLGQNPGKIQATPNASRLQPFPNLKTGDVTALSR